MNVELYTDGGCHGNPGPGGWAYHLRPEGENGEPLGEASGFEARTTNNRMELTAVIMGLRAASRVLHDAGEGGLIRVFTDSQYVQKGISSWIRTWKANGWKTSAKKPVKNQDLWKSLDELSSSLDVQWSWLKGHDGHIYNEACDRMVQEAINSSKK